MTAPLIDWSSDRWGQVGHNVHEATWAPDRHTQEVDDD